MSTTNILAAAQSFLGQPEPIEALKAHGLTLQRSTGSTSDSLEIGGIPVSSTKRHHVVHEWTLPGAPSVQAEFVHEHLRHKLIKLFKSEVEIGDPLFDEIVYVSTDTDEAARAFLKCPGVPEAIIGLVGPGGSLRIKGNTATLKAMVELESDTIHAGEEATLLAHLAAMAL